LFALVAYSPSQANIQIIPPETQLAISPATPTFNVDGIHANADSTVVAQVTPTNAPLLATQPWFGENKKMNDLRFIQLARKKMVWKCQKCGAFLEKQLGPEVACSFVGLAGIIMCENCRKSYSASDLYGGRLDVSVKDVLLALGPERLRDESAIEPLLEAVHDEDTETQNLAAYFLLKQAGLEIAYENSASQVILVN
jgi:hypothetical protein